MPSPPPPPVQPPYDTLESVLNVARTRLNDAIASIGGDILTDTQPFTAVMTNSAWRKTQAYLSNLGFSRYKRKFFAYTMPVINSQDPAAETIWTWTYFYDATSYFVPPTVNVLPGDLIAPLKISERQSGTNQVYSPMQLAPDGLPEGIKMPWNRFFEWKNDAVYMPGSTFPMDLELEYAAYDNDFPSSGNVLTLPGTQLVPIARVQSGFANYLCAEMAWGRDDIDYQKFIGDAQVDLQLLMNNSDVKLKQRRPVQRRPYARRNSGSTFYSTCQGY